MEQPDDLDGHEFMPTDQHPANRLMYSLDNARDGAELVGMLLGSLGRQYPDLIPGAEVRLHDDNGPRPDAETAAMLEQVVAGIVEANATSDLLQLQIDAVLADAKGLWPGSAPHVDP